MAFTIDEPFDIAGDLLKSVAEKLRDEETPGTLSKPEIYELIKQVIMDTIAEVSD